MTCSKPKYTVAALYNTPATAEIRGREMNWFDRAAKEIDDLYDQGQLSNEEYQEEMRGLRDEWRESAHEAAEQIYREQMDI